MSEKVRGIEAESPGDFTAIHPYVRGELYRKSFQETGDVQSSCWSCGVVMGLIDDIPDCTTLLDNIVAEAEDIIRNRMPTVLSKL